MASSVLGCDASHSRSCRLWYISKASAEKPITGTLLKRVQLVLSNLIYIEKKELPESLLDRIIRLAAFENRSVRLGPSKGVSFELAPRHGFEPRFTAPKAAVLPLDDRGVMGGTDCFSLPPR